MRILPASIIFLLIFSGCEFRKKEAQLEEKEKALNLREEQVLIKEKNLSLREEALLKREQKLDSSSRFDSLTLINPQITGNWSATMVCTQTSCTGSAVGDTKTELWQINYEGSSVVAKALANSQLVRVYTGAYTADGLELSEAKTGSQAAPLTRMVVRLKMTDSTRMEGQREITREDCSIVYHLQLQKEL